MITVNGRFFAWAVLILAVAAFAALAADAGVSNRITIREVTGGSIALLAGIVAALWLFRESRQHGGRHRS